VLRWLAYGGTQNFIFIGTEFLLIGHTDLYVLDICKFCYQTLFHGGQPYSRLTSKLPQRLPPIFVFFGNIVFLHRSFRSDDFDSSTNVLALLYIYFCSVQLSGGIANIQSCTTLQAMPLTRSQIAKIKTRENKDQPDPTPPTDLQDLSEVEEDEMTEDERKAFGQAIMMHTVRILRGNDLESAHRIVNFLEYIEIETPYDLSIVATSPDFALQEADKEFTAAMTLSQYTGLLKQYDASDFPDSLKSTPSVKSEDPPLRANPWTYQAVRVTQIYLLHNFPRRRSSDYVLY